MALRPAGLSRTRQLANGVRRPVDAVAVLLKGMTIALADLFLAPDQQALSNKVSANS